MGILLATISPELDADASFLGKADDTVVMPILLPGDSPPADLLRMDLNLESYTSEELNAIRGAASQITNVHVAAALVQAVMREQARRAELVRQTLEKQKKEQERKAQ